MVRSSRFWSQLLGNLLGSGRDHFFLFTRAPNEPEKRTRQVQDELHFSEGVLILVVLHRIVLVLRHPRGAEASSIPRRAEGSGDHLCDS